MAGATAWCTRATPGCSRTSRCCRERTSSAGSGRSRTIGRPSTRLGRPDFDPRSEAVVTASALRAAGIHRGQGQSAQVRMVSYRTSERLSRRYFSAPGLLVSRDANYPGWHAVVDGVERPIVTTNYLFRGVWLDAGVHRVEFRFEPHPISRGLLIAAVAALIALVLLVFGPSLERRASQRGRPYGRPPLSGRPEARQAATTCCAGDLERAAVVDHDVGERELRADVWLGVEPRLDRGIVQTAPVEPLDLDSSRSTSRPRGCRSAGASRPRPA